MLVVEAAHVELAEDDRGVYRRRMATDLPAVLPAPLRAALEDDVDRDVGFTVLLITTSEAAWPRVSMVGVAELSVNSPERLLLALWPSSTAAANIGHSGRATLAAVVAGVSYVVHARARPLADITPGRSGRLACFALQVVAATADEAPYAVLETGVRFRLREPDDAIARWRELRAALRDLAARDAAQ